MPERMHFLHIFLDDLFFLLTSLPGFFHTFLKTYQYLSYLASSIPPDIFQCHDGGKILGNSQQKLKLLGGWRSNIEGIYIISPILPRICSLPVTKLFWIGWWFVNPLIVMYSCYNLHYLWVFPNSLHISSGIARVSAARGGSLFCRPLRFLSHTPKFFFHSLPIFCSSTALL